MDQNESTLALNYRIENSGESANDCNAVENTVSEANDNTNSIFSYSPWGSHTRMKDLINEWFGYGEYASTTNPSCYPGGISALEAKYGSEWRKNLSGQLGKVFYRERFIMIEYLVSQEKETISKEELLDKWERLWSLSRGVSGVESRLKRLKKEGKRWGLDMLNSNMFQ